MRNIFLGWLYGDGFVCQLLVNVLNEMSRNGRARERTEERERVQGEERRGWGMDTYMYIYIHVYTCLVCLSLQVV